uniref:Secreted protein n=1 Tax=Heterorhabditis bacteriophora TaxID=37862 RepID=A0A1I7W8A4_HETBA
MIRLYLVFQLRSECNPFSVLLMRLFRTVRTLESGVSKRAKVNKGAFGLIDRLVPRPPPALVLSQSSSAPRRWLAVGFHPDLRVKLF